MFAFSCSFLSGASFNSSANKMFKILRRLQQPAEHKVIIFTIYQLCCNRFCLDYGPVWSVLAQKPEQQPNGYVASHNSVYFFLLFRVRGRHLWWSFKVSHYFHLPAAFVVLGAYCICNIRAQPSLLPCLLTCMGRAQNNLLCRCALVAKCGFMLSKHARLPLIS